MSTITRRQALTGTAAIAALATVPSLPAMVCNPDADLFAATADWRTAKILQDEAHELNCAVYKAVEDQFTEYREAREAFIQALVHP